MAIPARRRRGATTSMSKRGYEVTAEAPDGKVDHWPAADFAGALATFNMAIGGDAVRAQIFTLVGGGRRRVVAFNVNGC